MNTAIFEGIELRSWTQRKSKYPYEKLSEVGGFFEVNKNDRFSCMNSCHMYIGRNALAWRISLGVKDGKYVIVRTA